MKFTYLIIYLVPSSNEGSIGLEETLLVQFGDLARSRGDTLLGMLTQAQMRDAERHRRWSVALVEMALKQDGNRDVLNTWVEKWVPLADAAIDQFCAPFGTEGLEAATKAKNTCVKFRTDLGLETS